MPAGDATHSRLGKTLVFAAAIEAGTGLALMIAPSFVVRWLLGAEISYAAIWIARCFGIALLALGAACWPERAPGAAPVRAMLIYNALIALYLGYLGTAEQQGGLLLWPAVALHAAVAGVLLTLMLASAS